MIISIHGTSMWERVLWRRTKAHMGEVTILDTKLAQASRQTQPAKTHQPVTWEIIIDCFKLLSLGVVYYRVTYKKTIAIDDN